MSHSTRKLHLLQVLLLLTLIILTVVILWPFQRALDRSMLQFRNQLIAYIEGELGRQISYSSISPAIFRHLEIRNLSIHDNSGEGAPLLTIRRVRITYSLFGLLDGEPLDALRGVSLENTAVDLDTRRDEDLLRLFTDIGGGGGRDPVLGRLRENLEIRGRNLSLRYRDDSRLVQVEHLFFDLNRRDELFALDLHGDFELRFPGAESGFISAQSRLRLQGSSIADLSGGEYSLALTDTESNLFSLPRVTFFISYSPREIAIRKIEDREPFDMNLSLDREGGRNLLRFQSEEFRPDSILTLRGELADLQPWLSSVVSGKAELSFDAAGGSPRYRGDIAAAADNSLLPAPLRARIAVDGDADGVEFGPLYIESELGRLTYRGSILYADLLADGKLSLRDLELPTGDLLNADITLSRDAAGMRVAGGGRAGSVLFPDIAGRVERRPDGWEYDLRLPIGSDPVFPAAVGFEGGYYPDGSLLQLAGNAQNLPLETVYRLAGGGEAPAGLARQGLLYNGSLFLYRTEGGYTYILPDSRIDAPGVADRDIRFQVSGNDGGFSFHLESLRYDGYEADGSVDLKLRGDEYEFSVDAMVEDLPYSFRGSFRDNQLIVTGTYLDHLLIGTGAEAGYSLVTRDFPIPLPDGVLRADVNSRGRLDRNGEWSFLVEGSRFSNLPFGGGGNSLELSLRVDDERVNVYSLSYSDSISDVQGNGYFRYQTLPTDSTVPLRGDGWLQLADSEGDESYQLILSLDDQEVESDFQFRNAPLSRFIDIPLRGLFSGDVTVRGLPTDPDVFVRLELNDGELNQDPFAISTVLSLENDRLSIREFDLEYLGAIVRSGRGEYRLDEGRMEFDAQLRFPLQDRILEGTVGIDAQTIRLTGNEDFTRILANPFDGTVFLDNIRVGDETREAWEIEFGYDGALFAFFGGPENAISGTFRDNRSFSLSVAEPLPLQLRLEGDVSGGELDAEFEYISMEIEPLRRGLRFPFFTPTSGTLTGRGVRVSGPVNDPDFSGVLTAKDLTAESSIIPEAIGPFDGVLGLDGKLLSIQGLQLPVGLGSISADLKFNLEHWVPSTYDIALVTGEERGIHVKTAISQLQLDGYARGSLSIVGDNIATEISGDLALSSAVLTLTGEAGKRERPGSRILRTDLTLETGRSVEFLWPSVTLPILRSFAKTGQEMQIRSDSADDTFSVVGEVEMQGGIILYFQRNFYIKEGSVTFRENEIKFDPLLSARAELREVNAEGEEVQIFLIVDERPFSQFAPRFESIPSYSDAEIAALLGSSIFGTQVGQSVNPSDALIQTSDILVSQLGIVRSFEQSMKEILNLDLFSIRTQIFQNILLDRMVVEEQVDEYSSTPASSAIGRYLDNTTLFLGKYFGDDVFLEAMLQVNSNEQFFAAYGGEPVYELDTEISVEWDTPFFLLDFSVSPDFRDIVSSITTARVGLSWALSF